MHRIGYWLLGLWRADEQHVTISPLGVEPGNLTDVPSIVAMTGNLNGEREIGSTWAYYVNPDFHPDYSPLSCSVNIGISWPVTMPDTDYEWVLDYGSRRLRQCNADSLSGSGEERKLWISFETSLETGAGELVEAFMDTTPAVRDFVITESDIYFMSPPETTENDTLRSWLGVFPTELDFVEGETVELCAKIFNIGFTSSDSVIVIFYDGDPRDSIVQIGWTDVALPALTGTDSSMAIAHKPWYLTAGSAGPHDIHVVVNHQYVLTDGGSTPNYYLSERDSSNNHAHAPLYVYPLDYATEELEDPWDMDEVGGYSWLTPDIDTVVGAISYPTDSISGVCELQVDSLSDSMQVYLHVGSPRNYIYTDSFDIFRARVYVSDSCSLQVFWYDAYSEEQRLPESPQFIYLRPNRWNIVREDLSEGDWGETVAIDRFGFVIYANANDMIRLSWVKLTKE